MNFDYPGYELKFIQKQRCRDGSAHLYTLIYKFYSPVTRYFYILHADYHKEDVFAVKFYCKKDRHSDFKYSKIINKGDVGNILVTCAKVVPILLKTHPTASFGFFGARTFDQASKRIEPSLKTQRFRIYKHLVHLKFGNKSFAHFEYESISCYLLVNRHNKDIHSKERNIVKMFSETYKILPDIV